MSSSSAANKARRSLTEQFEMLYGAPPASAAAPHRPSGRSPSGTSLTVDPMHKASPQQYYRSTTTTTNHNGNISVGGGNDFGSGNANSFAFLHEAIRNHGAEIELERRTREAAVRDLSARTTVEVGELREMIKQLRQDNNNLKEQLWSLERRKPLGGGMVGVSADGYFGGATALTNVQMPLIPRVTDLETAVEQLRQKLLKLQGMEKSRDETLQKALVDQQVHQREVLDAAKEYVRLECDRREAGRVDPLEQQVRELMSTQHEQHRTIGRNLSEANGAMGQLGERVRSVEDAVREVSHGHHAQSQIEDLKRAVRASSDADSEKLRSAIQEVRAELTKAIRKQEVGDVEVQEALQTFITQRVDVVRVEMLPRDEMVKLNAIVSNAQKDVDRATDMAQAAKISSEETRRELTKRVTVLEGDEAASAGKLAQLGNEVAATAQAAKSLSGIVDEVKAAVKASQLALADHSERITTNATRAFEHAGLMDSVGQEVSRLRAAHTSSSSAEATERQQLKERLAAAEDELKGLRTKVVATDEAHQLLKRDTDRSMADMKATFTAEERASSQAAQQKTIHMVGALESRMTSFDERCTTTETHIVKVREDVMAALRTKVEDVREVLSSRLSDCDEVCRERQREVKEALQRAEERASGAVSRAKAVEVAVEGLPSHADVERAATDAKDAMAKTIQRSQQDQTREVAALRDDVTELRVYTERAVAELHTDTKSKGMDAASKVLIEDVRARMEEIAVSVESMETTTTTTIQKIIRERLKVLSDTQTTQKDEFDEFQTLIAELAQRLKSVAAVVEEHEATLRAHEGAMEAAEKSSGTIYSELMMAVSVACSHEQQFGAASTSQHQLKSPDGVPTADTVAPTVSIKSMGDVVQYILNCVADAQQEQQEQMQQAMEEIARTTAASQQGGVTEPPITEDDVHAALQTVSGPLMELTKIVDRHEIGFSMIHEIVQGIRFNNKSVMAVATAVGVDTEGLRLHTLDDSELQDALSEAAADTKDRESEITERERNWM